MQEERQSRPRPSVSSLSALELIWASLATALTTWSLLAVGLAQLCLFQAWTVVAAILSACAAGWGTWQLLKPLAQSRPRREAIFLAILLAGGGLLYSWPAEEFPQNGDASIYPNTATMLIRTGGLTYHYEPLDGLTAEQKELFYIPADRQLTTMEIQSYEGLLYGAYYVMDPDQNTIVSSRPPLTIVWMGLLGTLGGEQGTLYVTPLFGTLSLIAVYFLGKRLFDTGAGAVAALWLLVSFPQLHFSRTAYAEVVGQFFVLAFLYMLVTYWQTGKPIYIPIGFAALTAAFAARIDTILALPTLFLFLALLAIHRNWKAVRTGLVCLVLAALFTVWTVNRPYVGATAELLLGGQLRLISQLSVIERLGALSAGLGLVALLAWLMSRMPAALRSGIFRWGLTLLVVLGVAYALWVRPLFTEYTLLADGMLYPTHNEEILATISRYLSPWFFWLAAAGMVLLAWRKQRRFEQILLLLFVISFAGPFVWKYTTARVYPVALRRFLPEVLPALSLFAASVVHWLGQRPPVRWVAAGAAGLTAALLLGVSGPYWFHQGGGGALDLLDTLVEHIPPDGIVLFEPRQEGSVVGWFASPLWSSHQVDALMLNDADLDGDLLDGLLCQWHRDGREVYLLAQKDPTAWWPGVFAGHVEDTLRWNSSIIGQSLQFPPFVWRFDFQFQLYLWDGSACPAS